MDSKLTPILLFFSTLLAGLLAGFFYTWSFTIMQSLNLIDERNAAMAMISINANIRTDWFAIIFFGAPLSILLSLLVTLRAKNRSISVWISLALFFAIATLAITFTKHLPLNNELEDGADWSSYYALWVQWNHARMVTSLLAFMSMLCAYASSIKSIHSN